MVEEELIIALREMQDKEVERLPENSRKLFDAIMKIADERDSVKQENQQLKEQLQQRDEIIEKTIEKLIFLVQIGFDYDGFNTVESLKMLIDELVSYAEESLNILDKYKGDNK